MEIYILLIRTAILPTVLGLGFVASHALIRGDWLRRTCMAFFGVLIVLMFVSIIVLIDH